MVKARNLPWPMDHEQITQKLAQQSTMKEATLKETNSTPRLEATKLPTDFQPTDVSECESEIKSINSKISKLKEKLQTRIRRLEKRIKKDIERKFYPDSIERRQKKLNELQEQLKVFENIGLTDQKGQALVKSHNIAAGSSKVISNGTRFLSSTTESTANELMEISEDEAEYFVDNETESTEDDNILPDLERKLQSQINTVKRNIKRKKKKEDSKYDQKRSQRLEELRKHLKNIKAKLGLENTEPTTDTKVWKVPEQPMQVEKINSGKSEAKKSPLPIHCDQNVQKLAQSPDIAAIMWKVNNKATCSEAVDDSNPFTLKSDFNQLVESSENGTYTGAEHESIRRNLPNSECKLQSQIDTLERYIGILEKTGNLKHIEDMQIRLNGLREHLTNIQIESVSVHSTFTQPEAVHSFEIENEFGNESIESNDSGAEENVQAQINHIQKRIKENISEEFGTNSIEQRLENLKELERLKNIEADVSTKKSETEPHAIPNPKILKESQKLKQTEKMDLTRDQAKILSPPANSDQPAEASPAHLEKIAQKLAQARNTAATTSKIISAASRSETVAAPKPSTKPRPVAISENECESIHSKMANIESELKMQISRLEKIVKKYIQNRFKSASIKKKQQQLKDLRECLNNMQAVRLAETSKLNPHVKTATNLPEKNQQSEQIKASHSTSVVKPEMSTSKTTFYQSIEVYKNETESPAKSETKFDTKDDLDSIIDARILEDQIHGLRKRVARGIKNGERIDQKQKRLVSLEERLKIIKNDVELKPKAEKKTKIWYNTNRSNNAKK